jgi:autotransporter translocation and assembly factor TamB
LQNISFKEAQVTARLAPPWIEISQIAVRMPSAGQDITGGGRLPMHLLFPAQGSLPLHLTLQAPDLESGLLTAAVPGLVIDRGGSGSLMLTADGLYPDISIDGALKANFPHMALPAAGLDLRSFAADIRSHGKTIEVVRLGGQTPKGPLTMTGTSTLPNLNFTVQGKEVVLKIPKQLDAQLDLALLVGGDLEGPDISGEVQIQEATYTVPQKDKRTIEKEKAEEERKAGQEQTSLESSPSIWEGTTLNVHADWPRNVWYRDGLTKIETSGDLRIQKDEGAAIPYMSGRIALVRGFYDAYGRSFEMDSGDIVFTGPPDINPTLNLRAKYSSGGTDIFLDVKGTAKKPELHLSSNPPLPEQDIISVLVLGTPLNQVGSATGGPETSKSQQAQALKASLL